MFPGAHEPTVARAPTGEYVMMFTSAPWGPNGQPPVNATHFKPCDCTSLDTTKQCGWSDLTDGVPGVTPPPIGYLSRGMPTFMSYAKTPAGPWSPPMSIPIRGLGDANFAFSKNTTLQSTRNPPLPVMYSPFNCRVNVNPVRLQQLCLEMELRSICVCSDSSGWLPVGDGAALDVPRDALEGQLNVQVRFRPTLGLL